MGLLRDPVTTEKRALLAARWQGLDEAIRLPGQGLGQKATGCGATVGIQPRCDFACTGCYLGHEANKVPALPTAAVLAQLDALRRHLGPKSNVQITDGEATLRPLPELIEILRHARAIGVIPMLMTHGDNFRRQPGMLERLMTDGLLTEVSIHIDITQRGRDGYRAPTSELELMPLREEFARLVRAARRRTRRHLRAAMTLTVTQQNLLQIGDVVRWTVANRDAFSLLSFQPLAQVGRTRKQLQGVSAAELWREIGRGTAGFGLALEGTGPLFFGHPECTRFVPLLAIERPAGSGARAAAGRAGPRLLQLIRDRPEDLAVMQEFFARGLGGTAFRDDRPAEMAARGLGLLARAPGWFFGPVRRWAGGRLRSEAGIGFWRLLGGGLARRLRVDSLTLTSHHFMSPEELTTPLGRARLAACVFRLPDRGEMVPMCRMNAGGVRERIYGEIAIARAARPPAPAPGPGPLPVVH
ncbi:MAG TPA: radical SAM protein [Thermoanaerobaculia bacterium]|nr:radical SAM protein [Thermoanaerobaculia bacterium]